MRMPLQGSPWKHKKAPHWKPTSHWCETISELFSALTKCEFKIYQSVRPRFDSNTRYIYFYLRVEQGPTYICRVSEFMYSEIPSGTFDHITIVNEILSKPQLLPLEISSWNEFRRILANFILLFAIIEFNCPYLFL